MRTAILWSFLVLAMLTGPAVSVDTQMWTPTWLLFCRGSLFCFILGIGRAMVLLPVDHAQEVNRAPQRCQPLR